MVQCSLTSVSRAFSANLSTGVQTTWSVNLSPTRSRPNRTRYIPKHLQADPYRLETQQDWLHLPSCPSLVYIRSSFRHARLRLGQGKQPHFHRLHIDRTLDAVLRCSLLRKHILATTRGCCFCVLLHACERDCYGGPVEHNNLPRHNASIAEQSRNSDCDLPRSTIGIWKYSDCSISPMG